MCYFVYSWTVEQNAKHFANYLFLNIQQSKRYFFTDAISDWENKNYV